MQQGQVVALYNYMAQMIVELIKLASLIITLNKSAACANRVADILKVKSSMNHPVSTASTAVCGENAVEFHDVTFTYAESGAPSLSNISFSVKRGQTIGIIGGTGSGKSTLVNLIARFYDATSGTIQIDGQNIQNYSQPVSYTHLDVYKRQRYPCRSVICESLSFFIFLFERYLYAIMSANSRQYILEMNIFFNKLPLLYRIHLRCV